MADTGSKSPTSCSSVGEAPWDGYTWGNPSNAQALDASFADAKTLADTDTTAVLKCQGFDFSAVPAGATIDGVECSCWCKKVGAADLDLMQLLDTTGARTGDNQCVGGVAIGDIVAEIPCGGAADTWSCALTRTWVQHANFGVGVGTVATANETEVYVDHVEMTVHYTEAASAGSAKSFIVSWSRPTIISGC